MVPWQGDNLGSFSRFCWHVARLPYYGPRRSPLFANHEEGECVKKSGFASVECITVGQFSHHTMVEVFCQPCCLSFSLNCSPSWLIQKYNSRARDPYVILLFWGQWLLLPCAACTSRLNSTLIFQTLLDAIQILIETIIKLFHIKNINV